ncbi:MAG: CoA-binding protein [Bacteroidales bacterium]|jgi:predicted CoA-binding protein|nr:CoA-binding protein [Bacteroidales bacterium]
MEIKKTIVLGASPNPARYSFKAVKSLLHCGHETIAVGFRPGVIYDNFIQRGTPEILNVHTIALYIGLERQEEYHDYILSLNPQRIIFNPGTINEAFMEELTEKGIEVVEGCTLVMLDSGEF